jgi:hypothetical protein
MVSIHPDNFGLKMDALVVFRGFRPKGAGITKRHGTWHEAMAKRINSVWLLKHGQVPAFVTALLKIKDLEKKQPRQRIANSRERG